MQDRNTIQSYINNFRRHLSPYLKPDIGLSCRVYPAESGGAILELTIGFGIANVDNFGTNETTVNDALAIIPQRGFGGNLKGFHFGGTNVVMEDNRIILIKGEDNESIWNDQAAREDVNRILPPSAGGVR